MSILTYLDKILLGITLAAPLGPVSIEMIRRGLRHGFWSAFSVRLGGGVGNTLCLLAASYGLSHLLAYPWLLNLLGIIGAVLLLHMGYKTLRKGAGALDLEGDIAIGNALTWGFYLAIANPVALVFWTGIFAANIDPSLGVTAEDFAENLLIILGALLWGGALSAFLALGHRVFSKTNIVRISQASALFMFYFGLKYLWIVAQRML